MNRKEESIARSPGLAPTRGPRSPPGTGCGWYETKSPFRTFASSTKPGREIRHASTSNLSPSTTAVATSRTRCTQGFLSIPPTARPTTSAASSTSTNSQRRSFPYENRRRTHKRDPIPRLHLGRGSVPLHCCHAFRVFCASPVHRVHWSQLGQKVAALYGETRKPRPRDMARVSGCWRRLSSLFQDALPPDRP